MAKSVFLCLVLTLVVLASACAGVKPWERGRLANECMQVPVDSIEASYEGHINAVREASVGGASAGGGGCGCN